MADQYTVELGFNRPPEDIRRMSEVLMRLAHQQVYPQIGQGREDIIYSANIMEKIASKMEE